jgi:hypothetical protein
MYYHRKSKYHNEKVVAYGEIFDSKHEAQRFLILRDMERRGEITGLKLQEKFLLIPTQREKSTEIYKAGKNKGKPKPGKVIEKEVAYYADFVYTDSGGNLVVEDAKGYKAGAAYTIFTIKRKLMLYIHGIRIKEV